jgi:hypothetical protein
MRYEQETCKINDSESSAEVLVYKVILILDDESMQETFQPGKCNVWWSKKNLFQRGVISIAQGGKMIKVSTCLQPSCAKILAPALV